MNGIQAVSVVLTLLALVAAGMCQALQEAGEMGDDRISGFRERPKRVLSENNGTYRSANSE